MNQKKLLLNDKVEVRQLDKGLLGSWYSGVVVGVSGLCRTVRYDELLAETGDSKLIESIPVSNAVEGLHQRRYVSPTYRGHIRPLPPPRPPGPCGSKLHFGVCVDVWVEDGWWEGVVLDSDDDANERFVFFPDEADEGKFSVDHIRLSRVWDEFVGTWTDRGVWILVEVIKKLEGKQPLSGYVKKVWSYLRQNYGFVKMIAEWTCGIQSLWRKYYMNVIYVIAVKSSRKNLSSRRIRALQVRKKGNASEDNQQSELVQHLSDSFVGKNNDVLANVGSEIREEEINRVGEPKQKKRSLRSENKLKQSRDHNVNGFSNSTFQEKQVIAEASVAESIAHVGGEQDQLPSDYCAQKNEVPPDSLPIQNQSSKICGVAKSGPVLVSQDDSKKVPWYPARKKKVMASEDSRVHKSRSVGTKNFKTRVKNKLPLCASNTQKSQTILRRNIIKPSKSRRTLGILIPTYTEKLRSRRASLFFTTQRKRSNIKRRVSKRFLQFKSNIKCISEENQKLDAANAENEVSTSCRHSALPVESSCKNIKIKDMVSSPWMRKGKGISGSRQRDTICIVCHYGEDLIFCGGCPCSYHMSCIDLKVIPVERWFCPSCRCGLCGSRYCSGDKTRFANACPQCNRIYHVGCLNNMGRNPTDSFCSDACHKIYAHLHQLLGISNPTAVDGLTWTLLTAFNRDHNISRGSRIDTRKKLVRALRVVHDCFEPTVEPYTGRDLASDIVFSSVSKLRRLDFHGFYVMVLEKGDDLVCVATVRIHGKSAAEMPLIATDFKYRRQGMCRILMHELEKLLTRIGVERLVLPAISQLRETWETSFGFSEMSRSERVELSCYPFLVFQGTLMFQKFLSKPSITNETNDPGGDPQLPVRNVSTAISRERSAGHDNRNRSSGFGHKRKLKTGITGKENALDSCDEDEVQKYENVYKRRRILANRDSRKGG